MQDTKRCECKYKNPVEYICTFQPCQGKRVICQSCAWNHRNHEKYVQCISSWKEQMTNDCVIQRLTNIKSNQAQTQCLTHFIELAKGELIEALNTKSRQLTTKLQNTCLPMDKTIESVKNLANGNYPDENILYLIKEFPNCNVNERLDHLELESYKKTQSIISQVLSLMDKIVGVLDYCEQKPNLDLKKLQTQMSDFFKKAQKNDIIDPIRQNPQNQMRLQQEEEKDDKLNDFLQKINNNKFEQRPARPQINNNLSFSTLNYIRMNDVVEASIRTERQSFYLPRQDQKEDSLSNSRANLPIQPLSTRSNPYNNVMLQKRQLDQQNSDQQQANVVQFQQQFQQRNNQNQKSSLQQFYFSKLNQKKDTDANEQQLSKSFYDYSSQRRQL